MPTDDTDVFTASSFHLAKKERRPNQGDALLVFIKMSANLLPDVGRFDTREMLKIGGVIFAGGA